MTDKNEKGILSFFQNTVSAKVKKSSEVIDLDDHHDDDEQQSVEEGTQKQLSPMRDGLQKEATLDTSQDDSQSSNGDTASSSQSESRQSEKNRMRELKRVQREAEKLRREQLKAEEKLKKEKKKEEERLRREEEKKKREEEKRLKELQREEEKRKREQAKEEERKKKEQLRLQKEEEKRQKEEEKRLKEEAKERAQSRIGNFFRKVSDDANKNVSRKTDYEKYFLPFYARDGVEIRQPWTMDTQKLQSSIKTLDDLLKDRNQDASTLDPCSWLKERSLDGIGYPIKNTAVSLLQQMTAKEKSDEELQTMLSMVPHKYIKFYENVRPPYIGTYSKEFFLPILDPFSTSITDFNYDYDSDLEWVNEEGEEGGVDNLESGEDDDDEEDDDLASEGEFDGFLDTENGDGNSKTGTNGKKFIGPLIPIVQLRSDISTFDEEDRIYFKKLAAVPLTQMETFSIDPNYITPSPSPIKSSSASQRDLKRAATDQNSSGLSTPTQSPNKKSKSIITEDQDLLTLLKEVQNSTFSLATVSEIIQKNLPKYNKQTIKNTVKEYAVRSSGKGNEPRKWEIKDLEHWENLQKAGEHKE